jgi:O-antigen ligase
MQPISIPIYQKFLLSLGILIPFSFALSPTKNIDLNILKLYIPIIFLFWLANSLYNQKIFLDNRPRFWLLLSFLFITTISIFWTPAPSNAFRKILFLITTIPLYFTVFFATNNDSFKNKLLSNLILGAFLASCLAILFSLSQFIIGLSPILNILRNYFSPIFLGNSLAELVNQYSSWLVNISGKTILRTFGTFPDPHLFSLYLSMILPINLYFYYKNNYQKKYLFFSIIIFLAILLSFSRAAYLAIIFGSSFLLINLNFKFLKKKVLSLYAIFVILLFLFIIPNPLISRLQSSFNLQEGSNIGRIEMWTTALRNIQEAPFLGLGLGGFANNLDNSLGIRNPIYAHNLLLDFGAETGIFNLFILFFIITSPILTYLNNKKNLSQNNLTKFIATSFVIFFIHSMFETPFFSIRVFPLFLILLAIPTKISPQIPTNKSKLEKA